MDHMTPFWIVFFQIQKHQCRLLFLLQPETTTLSPPSDRLGALFLSELSAIDVHGNVLFNTSKHGNQDGGTLNPGTQSSKKNQI